MLLLLDPSLEPIPELTGEEWSEGMDTEDVLCVKQAGKTLLPPRKLSKWGKSLQVYPDPLCLSSSSTLRSQRMSGTEEKTDPKKLHCTAQCCSLLEPWGLKIPGFLG